MMKRIVLCADDYGQAEAVSTGILDLLSAGRLTATTCLVNQAPWREHAGWLHAFRDKADIGLHLNFTEGIPLSSAYRAEIGETFMPLRPLLWHTTTRSKILVRSALEAEIKAQLDAFTDAMGCVPRFIDGHQHVHHLPGIREALLDVYRQRFKDEHVYMRAVTQDISVFNYFGGGVKNVLIHLTGGASFACRLDQYGIPHNTSFAGIYSFDKASQYRSYFQAFLSASEDHGLIMCHPGRPSDDQHDPIHRSRSQEYDYFNSADFVTDCTDFNVVLSRFELV